MNLAVGFVLIATTSFFASQSDYSQHRKSNSSLTQESSRPLHSSKEKQLHSTKTLMDSIQSFVEELAQTDRFSGVIAITKNGHTLFQRAYGLADHDSRLPNRMDTKFVIASVTQTFTAVAIAQLVSRGLIALDAPLTHYLPNYSGENSQATVRQLLLHTAGIGDVSKDEGFRRDPRRFHTLADYLMLVQSLPVTGEPGVQFRYSNGDCVLLGGIVEETSGENYYDYIGKHIFRLAGMTRSGFDLYPRPKNIATGYTSRDLSNSAYATTQEPRHNNQAILPTKASPGVAAFSSARDLVRYGNAILHHQLLNVSMTNDCFGAR